ncbi:phage portal protein [Gordonia sp. X0973]|uniref:phage portal protein n=1 Tax=Gordonia sp. X0973 TaxID=2742602 RepID=UPI000F532D12|nr:phage portal protein [Gordonia sp. X0973]QKT08040.1 phage portal protein [Gordonia sp. X0973]
MTINDTIQPLTTKLDTTAPKLAALDRYWTGTQPAAFLSTKSREALDGRLTTLSVNFPRMTVRSRSERLEVNGFRTSPDGDPDPDLWRIWTRNGLESAADAAHVDALLYGRSFAVVWADSAGNPTISIESAHQLAVEFDPLTREVLRAFKRWVDPNAKRGYAVLYEREAITKLTADARTGDPAALSATAWSATEIIPNPLGIVPVVPIVNRGRLLELDGTSEADDVLGLTDALAKLLADAMTTSEFYARPRRWVTGLEIVEEPRLDDAGNPVLDEHGEPIVDVLEPFSNEMNRMMHAEDPDTRFGQFDAARLDGYGDMIATITNQVGALSGLPPHYLGLAGDQPASAEALRASEASLVSRCYDLQQQFGRAWSQVMALAIAVRDGVDPRTLDISTMWASPETRTPAEAADAAAKLTAIGVPLTVAADVVLGWTPEQIARLRTATRLQSLDTAPLTLAPQEPAA